MQFSRQGNFSYKIGGITINGRYSLSDEAEEGRQLLDGGASVFFGGLEFRLVSTSDGDEGFSLVKADGGRQPASPDYFDILENEAVFALPGGAELTFSGQNAGGVPGGAAELKISGKFPAGVSAIDIPFKPLRSSVIRAGDRGTINISYNGTRYQFSRPLKGLEEGRLILLASTPAVSYRVITDDTRNDPADFIVPLAQTPESFNDALALWTERSFELWGSTMSAQTGEDAVIAWCAEAIRQGRYRSAISTIPSAFSARADRGWESAVYQFDRKTGIWDSGVRAISAQQRERAAHITRMLEQKDINVFAESRLIEYLAIRDYGALIDRLAAFARDLDPFSLTLGAGCGVLECFIDMGKWRPRAGNPFEHLTERAGELAAEGLYRSGDQVFVFTEGRANTEFNLRLGMALKEWGEKTGESDWAALGRSLALSVLSLCDESGQVPASLTIGPNREFVGGSGTISSAMLYRDIGGSEYLPRAASTGLSGVWAWTAASSISVTQNERQMDIRVGFPAGETHYLMLRNIRPFPILQIYENNWRRASDFESYYDSSGWYYFESEQTLVLKIRHRQNVENIRILYVVPRAEPPPPPPPPEPAAEEPVHQEQHPVWQPPTQPQQAQPWQPPAQALPAQPWQPGINQEEHHAP
ncbi:MAG: hypothetical protein FWG46_07605 [Treponema sp.]|nr:hypothetical protein [Treponema sp.]